MGGTRKNRLQLIDPIVRNGRVGLFVADMQTLHLGHVRALQHMRETCERGIVAIGSTQLHGVPGHPFTFEQRRDMVLKVFGRAFYFVALQDIDASLQTNDWMAYVQGKIRALGMPEPTDYFTGSEIDARYYTGHFAPLTGEMEVIGDARVFRGPEGRRLHLIDRSRSSQLSGREIRILIEDRDDTWRSYVPVEIHDYIEMNYPPHLRVAIRSEMAPEGVPVGTRWIMPDGVTVMALKDDGKWRPFRDRLDEKSAYAARAKGNISGQ